MQIYKFLAGTRLAATGAILAFTLTRDPSAWASPQKQAVGLYWLPWLLPLLAVALELPVAGNPVAVGVYKRVGESWTALLKWVTFLPLLVFAASHEPLRLVLGCLAAAAVSLYLLSEAKLMPVSEVFLTSLLAEPLRYAPYFAFSLVAGFSLRLPIPGLVPLFTGYALALAKPLYLTGLASISAWLYHYFSPAARTYTATLVQQKAFCSLLLPALAFFVKTILDRQRTLGQLNLFPASSSGHWEKKLLKGSMVLVLLVAATGKEALLVALAAALGYIYTTLAKGTVGLILFPSWAFLGWLAPGHSGIFLEVALGLMAALAAILVVSYRQEGERYSLTKHSGFPVTLLFFSLIFAVLLLSWQPVARGLAEFPSDAGNWLASLTGVGFSPFIWILFMVLMIVGILREAPNYIYFAWGLLLPAPWGASLLIGWALRLALPAKIGLKLAVGRGLITGDILASFLLLFN
ncbi:MAG: hypothetical protein H0Z38_07795 [Firmicutes bacterium]|nr:hypothetical protein [Bacillota bacterium]